MCPGSIKRPEDELETVHTNIMGEWLNGFIDVPVADCWRMLVFWYVNTSENNCCMFCNCSIHLYRERERGQRDVDWDCHVTNHNCTIIINNIYIAWKQHEHQPNVGTRSSQDKKHVSNGNSGFRTMRFCTEVGQSHHHHHHHPSSSSSSSSSSSPEWLYSKSRLLYCPPKWNGWLP